jgi:3,4-dihydroxy 2-butanone 4-phosphate synthase/GTP cyclohydrolase II
LKIVERVPLESAPTDENIRYLTTKREKLGHLLEAIGAEKDPDTEVEGVNSADV